MARYIALLRGINVSGTKKILMKDLRLLFTKLGFKEVVTYIQSGNVVFTTKPVPSSSLEEMISNAIKKGFGYDVPVIVRSRDQIGTILSNNPYKDQELLAANKVGYILFKQPPKKELLDALEQESFENEELTIIANCGYLVYHKGAGRAKLNNNLIERKLKIDATGRNHRTMMKLMELSQ